MGLSQPAGRIVVNTGVGDCGKIDLSEVSEFGYIGGDEVRHYTVKGKPVTINRFKKAIKELEKAKF